MQENANNENAAPAAAAAYFSPPARKLKTRKTKHIINAFGNPVLKAKKATHITFKNSSKLNRVKQQKQAARKAASATIRGKAMAPVTSEVILERIERYRKEANDIYDEGGKSSLEKSKELLGALERTYYRMKAVKMGDVVEVEIDRNTIAENILEAINNILQELEDKVRVKMAADAEDDEFANLFGGLLKL